MQKPTPRVIAACRALEENPACLHTSIDEKKLLGFGEYPEKVVVIIETGQKYSVFNDELEGYLKAKKTVEVSEEAVKATETAIETPKRPTNTRRR